MMPSAGWSPRCAAETCRPAALPPCSGEPRGPLDGASDREEKSTQADRRITRGLAIGGIGLLFVGALAVMGLAVLWRPGRPR